ncbi:MAG: hypothetical protein AMXMBFR16_12730 [Candidatus Uhrbacteria bacterium]
MMPSESLSDRRAEFASFVWNHAADAFQAKFDIRAKLTDSEIIILTSILAPKYLQSSDLLSAAVRDQVAADNRCLPLLLQLTGLTRNKILQDIKAFARNSRLNISLSSPRAMFGSESGARLASEYIARQLRRTFGASESVTPAMLEAVNQATWPGYIRQERAKRMGHEAEYRIACLLRDCRLPFAPAEKAENPLCRDVKIDDVSYDLVSPSATQATLRIKSTVHTANIGQYGESKDDLEIREAVDAISSEIASGSDITLLAFIDGVGFESNRAGLDGVLSKADEFCQFRTIWKAAAIAANKSGEALRVALPPVQLEQFRSFESRWQVDLERMESDQVETKDWVPAGDGFVSPKKRRI